MLALVARGTLFLKTHIGGRIREPARKRDEWRGASLQPGSGDVTHTEQNLDFRSGNFWSDSLRVVIQRKV